MFIGSYSLIYEEAALIKRSKHEYGKKLWSGIRLSFSILWGESKIVIFVCLLAVITRVILPYLGILMPKVVLDQITSGAEPKQFFLVVGGTALLMALVNFIKAFSDPITNAAVGIAIQSPLLVRKLDKSMNMDYELMEDPDFKAAEDKADKAMFTNHSPAVNIPKMLVELLASSFGFLLYAGVIIAIHPLILLVLLLTSAVNWLMLSRARKSMESTRDERSKLGRKLNALSDVLRQPESAKDIRLYGAFGWLSGLYRKQFTAYTNAEREPLTKNMQAQLVNALMILLRDGAAYSFLIWLVLNDRMSLGSFVYVFAAVGALAGWVSGILTAVSDIGKASVELDDLQAAITYPDRMNTGKGVPLPKGNDLPPSIELKGIGYTYPKAEKPTLKGIDVNIRAGERIAIVGANGTGKTTLIKILCGLYLPTEGEVLLNGIPINEFNRDEYYTLFSAVFQDIHLLSSSIEENISQKPAPQTDRALVKGCLEAVGLSGKVDSLPSKENTLLVRQVNPDATELSGGEKQKLAMARALYNNGTVLLLDEPTAALDPIAENEVYQKYAELTEGKTSVYISHRLASTRFCDRILLLDGNRIAEQGTHDELVALGGVYANMFTVQASYYQEGSPND